MDGAELALEGLDYAAANLPDKVLEAVPGGYFKTEEQKEQKEQKRRSKARSKGKSHNRRPSPSPAPQDQYDGDQGSRSDEYEHSRGRTPEVYKQSRCAQREVEDSYIPCERGEERYKPHERQYPQGNRIQPRKMNYPEDRRDSYQPRPYNPQDYVRSAATRSGYYNEPQYGASRAAYPRPDALYRRPSSAGPVDRYRRHESPDDNGQSDRGRHHERHHHRKHRTKSHKGSRSRSRSSSRGLVDRFDTSGRGVGSATIGAIAGGLIGNTVGKGIMTTVAGAVLGGLGANVWENHHQKDKEERGREREEGRRGSHGSPERYTKGYASDGDYERDERAERRRRRRREREREERDSRG